MSNGSVDLSIVQEAATDEKEEKDEPEDQGKRLSIQPKHIL